MSEIFQLFECADVFQFTDPADSYQTWQGLQGPKGDPGEPGPPGQGLTMKGPVATTGDLPATAPSNELWLVGAAAPYHGWFYNGVSWEDAGEIAIGPEGPPGQDGADGAAATIAVGTVSGLPAGSTPTVTNTGTSAAAVFDFGIPAGADGQTGPAGPGVAAGGTAGQVLTKASSTDYDTSWTTPAEPATASPNMDGTAAAGTSSKYAREDHVHPSNTAKVDKTVTLPGGTDLNTVITSGFYRLSNNITNGPLVAVNWSQMIVCRGEDTIAQIIIGFSTSIIYVRSASGLGTTPNWRSWKTVNVGAGALYFPSAAMTAGTGTIVSISHAEITADYVLGNVVFSKPSAVTEGGNFSSGAGTFTMTGTCTDATCTAQVLLVKKSN